MYADSELGVSSTWVGDLEPESTVTLWSVHPDGHACFIRGGKLFRVGKSKGGWRAIVFYLMSLRRLSSLMRKVNESSESH